MPFEKEIIDALKNHPFGIILSELISHVHSHMSRDFYHTMLALLKENKIHRTVHGVVNNKTLHIYFLSNPTTNDVTIIEE